MVLMQSIEYKYKTIKIICAVLVIGIIMLSAGALWLQEEANKQMKDCNKELKKIVYYESECLCPLNITREVGLIG
jgi:hypothetical protein